jgi:hypothetical protein
LTRPKIVMPALVAGVHALLNSTSAKKAVDGRDKPGHDEFFIAKIGGGPAVLPPSPLNLSDGL